MKIIDISNGLRYKGERQKKNRKDLKGMKALITANFSPDGIERLKKWMEVVYEPWGDKNQILMSDEMAERLKQTGADVLILEADLCHEEVFEAVDLKMIGVCRGDPLNVDVEMASEKGIPVFYTPGRNADAVADLTLAFMLCLMRKVVSVALMMAQGRYEPEDPEQYMKLRNEMTGFELGGKTIGLVGFGAIGRKVARRLSGFGSRVIAYDPFVKKGIFSEFNVEPVSLEELFRISDIVSIHTALTDDTEGLIKREHLELMKPSAYFVNTARAELVDCKALVELLKSNKIAGAAVDVFLSEPPQKDDPFLNLPNVIATPHIGGATREVFEHQSEMIVNDIEAYLLGRTPKYLYNPEILEKKK